MKDTAIAAKIAAIENTKFIQVPGPNPLLVPGEEGAWDDGMLEMCDILKDDGKYYLYYHATGRGESYRIGVAVADSPLGPFKKYGDRPILDLCGFGEGDNDRYIACGTVFKESTDSYYLFYSLQQKDDELNYYIGVATAPHPLGPWTKSAKNPIMQNFGYVGGVTKRDGKYYMFNEYPTRIQAVDYGHISVAVADHPEGPWEPCRETPVMRVEDWGTWDDAGYSESNVSYDGTLFHMFYGGAKTHANRLKSQESIGYAYSVDGKEFIKYGRNPVARREAMAFGAAMAECCFLAEYPYIYVYHTLRYTEPWYAPDREKFPRMEHIGVQVLSVADRFTVSYPVLSLASLAGDGQEISDPAKLPLSVENADRYALTVSASYPEAGAGEVAVLLYGSYDGKSFDTEPLAVYHLPVRAGESVQKTFTGELCTRFLRVAVKGCEGAAPVADLKASITLKG